MIIFVLFVLKRTVPFNVCTPLAKYYFHLSYSLKFPRIDMRDNSSRRQKCLKLLVTNITIGQNTSVVAPLQHFC